MLSCFANDTRVMLAVGQEDLVEVQNDLGIIYSWAHNNNMVFNSAMFG